MSGRPATRVFEGPHELKLEKNGQNSFNIWLGEMDLLNGGKCMVFRGPRRVVWRMLVQPGSQSPL